MKELLFDYQEEETSRPNASLVEKRKSMRRLHSAPDSRTGSSQQAAKALPGKKSLRRSLSSPSMRAPDNTCSLRDDKREPPLRRKSTKTQPIGRSMSPKRSLSRKKLGIIESPATLMRNRRLLAVANMMNFELPGGGVEMSDDSIMREAFNRAA